MKHNFRALQIWQNGIELAVNTYNYCKAFPKEELFGLSAQMKKAAVSIPSNIAEGCGRGTDAQLAHFLDISLGSACELETQVIIAQRLKFLTETQAQEWIATLHTEQKQIRSFREKIDNRLL
jgi:four helix bundle protein